MLVRNVINKNHKKNTPNFLQFPEDIGVHGMLLVFKNYEFVSPGNRSLLDISASDVIPTSTNSILLPIPSNLQDHTETSINRIDMRMLGDLGATAISDALKDKETLADCLRTNNVPFSVQVQEFNYLNKLTEVTAPGS